MYVSTSFDTYCTAAGLHVCNMPLLLLTYVHTYVRTYTPRCSLWAASPFVCCQHTYIRTPRRALLVNSVRHPAVLPILGQSCRNVLLNCLGGKLTEPAPVRYGHTYAHAHTNTTQTHRHTHAHTHTRTHAHTHTHTHAHTHARTHTHLCCAGAALLGACSSATAPLIPSVSSTAGLLTSTAEAPTTDID